MNAIYLTGFMGAGKTTIGKLLSKKLQLNVIDSDQHIEEQCGKKISQIFNEHGESFFRELEANVLKTLPTENIIVTTGGGIVTNNTNVEWMKATGTVIYLHTEFSELMKRLRGDSTRPLLQQKSHEELKNLFAERLPKYNKADIIIHTSNKTVSEIVEEVLFKIEQ
ncbi:shikimate kinase [Bacillus sp. FJAT-45066]|uniref:shikimate kinase n=1 Tax=Bacillus sp. FJAT-45066 TaxID=2011010 RepID=UPI000BB8C555|nr:shikimate kinase [Bacillus sp. FJAT-45066]